MSNEQLSEKEEQKRTNHGPSDHQKSIQKEDSEWTRPTRGRIYRDHLWKIYTLVT